MGFLRQEYWSRLPFPPPGDLSNPGIKTEFIYRAKNGGTDIENRLMDMGRGEERVRCMQRVTWKLTLPSVNR